MSVLSKTSETLGDEYKDTAFWDIAPCCLIEADPRFRVITLMMDAEITFETSVHLYETTQRSISEGRQLGYLL
jgi:hypothetical protein